MTEHSKGIEGTFSIFADLFQWGPTEKLRSAMAHRAEFASLNSLVDGAQDEDHRAANHESLFGFNVFPFASVFLERDGRLGQDWSQEIRYFSTSLAIDIDALGDAPDHISALLRLLSLLDRRSADEAACIDRYFMSWIPAFVTAIQLEGEPFYSELAQRTVAALVSRRSELERTAPGEPIGAAPRDATSDAAFDALAEEEIESILDDTLTGVHEIAEYLSTPARCGMFVSRSMMTRWAKSTRLPHGFGSRKQMMATLIRSAVAYSGVETLVNMFLERVGENEAGWRAASQHPIPAAGEHASIWLARLQRTRHTVNRLRQELLTTHPDQH